METDRVLYIDKEQDLTVTPTLRLRGSMSDSALKKNLSQLNRKVNEFKAEHIASECKHKKKAPTGLPSRVRRYGEGTALATLGAFYSEVLLPQKITLAQKGPPRR